MNEERREETPETDYEEPLILASSDEERVLIFGNNAATSRSYLAGRWEWGFAFDMEEILGDDFRDSDFCMVVDPALREKLLRESEAALGAQPKPSADAE